MTVEALDARIKKLFRWKTHNEEWVRLEDVVAAIHRYSPADGLPIAVESRWSAKKSPRVVVVVSVHAKIGYRNSETGRLAYMRPSAFQAAFIPFPTPAETPAPPPGSIRRQWEDEALAIVVAVKRNLAADIDDNDGGELLNWILNLIEKVAGTYLSQAWLPIVPDSEIEQHYPDDLLRHAVQAPSQYTPEFRMLATEILRLRALPQRTA